MRLTTLLAGVMCAALAAPVFAGNIAVADSQTAIMGTEVAKASFDKLANELKPQREKIEALQKELAVLQEKFQKNSAVMSAKDRAELEKQASAKYAAYKSQADAYQQRAEEVKQEILNKLLPKAEVVIEDIRKAGGYDVIIDKRNVILYNKDIDITKKIIDKLNATK